MLFHPIHAVVEEVVPTNMSTPSAIFRVGVDMPQPQCDGWCFWQCTANGLTANQFLIVDVAIQFASRVLSAWQW